MILAGDIGGTKTNLGIFRDGTDRPGTVRKASYASADWPGLEAVVRDFLGRGPESVRAAAFGIAGPVRDGRVVTPNLAWTVEADVVARAAGTESALLLNDLEATAEGVPVLRPDEVETLAEGEPDDAGNAALVAPGTGLGMCVIARPGGEWQPLAGEGGHQTFAPRDEEEEALRRFLASRHGHVSVERILSGPGLVAVFDFLVQSAGAPAVLAPHGTEDPAASISRAALAGSCPVAVRALRIFVETLGSVAGNLALVSLGTQAVWIGGGIAPRILPALRDGTFIEAFRAKGRFRELLTRVPVRVILNPETALLGAARRALALA